MPKCIVIGEDPSATLSIAKFIEKQPSWNVAAQVSQLCEAAGTIRQHKAEVCFIDISFVDLSDLESVREMARELQCLWVFISPYPQRAASAFELGAIDYVVKPFSTSRLMSCIQKIEKRLNVRSQGAKPNQALTSVNDGTLVNIDDIFWIGVSGDYLELHCRNSKWLCQHSWVSLESQLDREKFVRVHPSALVNIKKVSSVSAHGGEFSLLCLSNGDELVVDHCHRTPLFESLGL